MAYTIDLEEPALWAFQRRRVQVRESEEDVAYVLVRKTAVDTCSGVMPSSDSDGVGHSDSSFNFGYSSGCERPVLQYKRAPMMGRSKSRDLSRHEL